MTMLARVNPAAAAAARLTPKDVAVLAAMADGLTYDAIARRLGFSEHTVRKHQKQAYQRLDVTGQVAAVVACFDRGIFRPLVGAEEVAA